jgi:N,N'-diacetyllegionaminate synthase
LSPALSSPLFSRIADESRCFVIAEIGSNHDGDFDTALRLMDIAREAGADAVKFQSFLADHLVTRDNPDYDLLKRLEVPRDWYPRLKREAEDRGLVFFSTATNDITLGWMEEIGVALYKIGSPNLTHLPLIATTAGFGKPVIVSTGMAGLAVIDEAVSTFLATGNRELALLHCVSVYPAEPSLLNLRAIQTLADVYPFPVGFSDHSLDIGTAVAAVALGAQVIEKHLTLDRSRPGPDHHYALEPQPFIAMGRNIRIVEQALGDGRKIVPSREAENSRRYWRSLHAARDLPAGAMLARDEIAVVRPNDGLHSRHLDAVIGLRLARALPSGAPITWDCFKAP